MDFVGVQQHHPQKSILFAQAPIQGTAKKLRVDCFNGELCHCRQSRGSVITPVTALAATVSGLARNTRASLCPMRPGKLRLVVLMQLIGVFSRPKVSLGPPRHAAHDGSPILAPAERKTSSSDWPLSISLFRPAAISLVAGTTNVSMRTLLPLRIRAAARKSVILPPVHEPMYARSSFVPPTSLTFARLSGLCGLATTGSSFVTS